MPGRESLGGPQCFDLPPEYHVGRRQGQRRLRLGMYGVGAVQRWLSLGSQPLVALVLSAGLWPCPRRAWRVAWCDGFGA